MDGQLVGWVNVEFAGIIFSFLIGEEVEERCGYQKFMADLTFC